MTPCRTFRAVLLSDDLCPEDGGQDTDGVALSEDTSGYHGPSVLCKNETKETERHTDSNIVEEARTIRTVHAAQNLGPHVTVYGTHDQSSEAETETRLKYCPLADAGLALCSADIRASKFSSRSSAENEALPIVQCTIPALSIRN